MSDKVRVRARVLGIASIVLSLCAVVVLALMNHPVVAVRLFSLILVIAGLFRIFFRRHQTWFWARTWWADAAVLIVMGMLVGYLAIYAGVIMPT